VKEIEYGLKVVGNFRLLNFATGAYMCKCLVCGKEFTGDKRAIQCLGCAIKAAEASCAELQSLKAQIVELVEEESARYHGGEGINIGKLFVRLRQLAEEAPKEGE